jgi:transketolase
MELVRSPHARNLVRWARDKVDVVVVAREPAVGLEVDDFRDACPERFASVGAGESSMAVAVALVGEGRFPFVHAFATEISPSDTSACRDLPVRLLVFGSGADDVAWSSPELTVLECGDATEVESVLKVAHAVDGPVVARMLSGEVPRLFAEPMKLGRVRVLSRGGEVAVVTRGVGTEQAMRAVAVLAGRGAMVTHVHVSTLQPYPVAAVREAIGAARGVITVENRPVAGGLGSRVAGALGAGQPTVRLGPVDGNPAAAVVRAVGELSSTHFDVSEEELAAVRLVPAPA